MAQLKQMVEKVRSKNAGPFWITIDVFCNQDGSFDAVSACLTQEAVSPIYGVAPEDVLRFELRDLEVIKLSFPRPQIQGTREDRDMHGAAFACILEEMEVTPA
ncbi:MAG: DUF4387 family protein [Litoreibacter sp.]|nr:DUF4387 family protein [Litoreibacter sp.]MCY4334175.1 DUF4387 family protein [Litoreibacter sp.]